MQGSYLDSGKAALAWTGVRAVHHSIERRGQIPDAVQAHHVLDHPARVHVGYRGDGANLQLDVLTFTPVSKLVVYATFLREHCTYCELEVRHPLVLVAGGLNNPVPVDLLDVGGMYGASFASRYDGSLGERGVIILCV